MKIVVCYSGCRSFLIKDEICRSHDRITYRKRFFKVTLKGILYNSDDRYQSDDRYHSDDIIVMISIKLQCF